MKIKLGAITTNKPLASVSRTRGALSSANWQYNQAGQQYNQAGVEYGGADRRADIGPRLRLISDI